MISCSWKTDGTPGSEASVHISDQPQEDGYTRIELEQSSQTGGSPVNLMATANTAPFPDSYWFQVRIVEKDRSSSVSVGVVLPSEFQQGYKNKGMFYNGNLTNGSAALKTGYGPYLQQGDVIVLECTHDHNSHFFALTIHVNGKRIGRGFEIATTDGAATFVPCLAIQGKNLKLLAQIHEAMPDLSPLERSIHPLEGKWKIEKAAKGTNHNDDIIPVEGGQEGRGIIMSISPETEDKLGISVHVFNNIGLQKQYTASPDKKIFDVVNVGHGPITTMMMPPPPYHTVEQELAKAMVDHWQSFRLVDENTLTITTMTNHVMAKCVRHTNEDGGATAALTKYHH